MMLRKYVQSNPRGYESWKAFVKRRLPWSTELTDRLSNAASVIHQKCFEDFVFIHIPKCGGTSVERALGVPLLNHDTALERLEVLGESRWRRRVCFSVVRNPFHRMASLFFYWERPETVGHREMQRRFSDWLAYIETRLAEPQPKKHIRSQWWWLANERGESLMDFVCRLESLDTDMAQVSSMLGRPISVSRIKTNRNEVNYEELYDSQARDRVVSWYREDFEQFGYETEL